MLVIINKGVLYKSAEVISKLYRSYIKPHLECCTQFWTPIDVKYAGTSERIKRRATIKMIQSLRTLHEERLKRLSIFSLRYKRLGGDMIEVFKIIHGTDKINLRKFFCVYEDRRTRKYSLCLKTKRHVNSNFFPRKYKLLKPAPRLSR